MRESPEVAEKPDVDACIEEAFTRLYAKIESLSPAVPPSQIVEQQAMAIIRTLGSELLQASDELRHLAEVFKMQPNLQTNQRLALANHVIKASRRAREAAESVLG